MGGFWLRPIFAVPLSELFLLLLVVFAFSSSSFDFVATANQVLVCSAGLSSLSWFHHSPMVSSSSWLLGSVCLALDQFLAVLANLLRPYIRVGRLRFSHSQLLIGLFTCGPRFLFSFLCVYVSPSFETISITHAAWLLFAF